MRKSLHFIWLVLTPKERKRFLFLSFSDIIICLVDITSLFLLLWTVQRFVQMDLSKTINSLPEQILPANSLLAVGTIVILFLVKNCAAFLLVRSQNKLSSDVAVRLS